MSVTMSPEMLLIGAVLKSGIDADGPDYIAGECAGYWIAISGLDPSAVWREWHRSNRVRVPPFVPAPCPCNARKAHR